MRNNKRKHKKDIKKKAYKAISEIANSNNIKTLSFDVICDCNITSKCTTIRIL